MYCFTACIMLQNLKKCFFFFFALLDVADQKKRDHFMKKAEEYLTRAEVLKSLKKEQSKQREHTQVINKTLLFFRNMLKNMTFIPSLLSTIFFIISDQHTQRYYWVWV